jgi:murein DD-endopeptidase MepM/ murein hydrolase activator NlpD
MDKSRRFHHGVDIPAPVGTEVRPVKDGTVVFSSRQRGYGNMVIIDHGDGYVTKYAHNLRNLVKEGDQVSAETVIAQVGSTGKSTGSHLHLEVRYKGKSVNPVRLIAENRTKENQQNSDKIEKVS